MKCTSCGEKLDISPGKSMNFCSNCGEKVAIKTAMEVIDSADAALRFIADNFGADVLLGSKIVSTFANVTRNQLEDEKDLIKILSEKGALECLKDATQKPASEQEIAIKRAIAKLPKFLQGSEDVDAMLRKFAAALGRQLPKPRPAAVPHPVSLQSQQQSAQPQTVQPQPTQDVILPNASVQSVNLTVCPSVGSIIKFADIDWCVLDVENNKALLISERILEKRRFDASSNVWAKSELYNYLNGQFYNSFNKSEKAKVYPSNEGHVFLLSIYEAKKYFKGCSAVRIARDKKDYASWWWLRSPGNISILAASVLYGGFLDIVGLYVNADLGGVRPALWLNFEL